jgi:hypothetical protein
LLFSFIVPPILFLMGYALSTKVRQVPLALDLHLLTAMQGWRVIGGVFLVLMSLNLLPGTFASPAGVGGLLVGGYAPFVVVSIADRTPGGRTHVLLLNVLGLLDLVTAIATGVLSGSSPLGLLRGPVHRRHHATTPIQPNSDFRSVGLDRHARNSLLKLQRDQTG